MKSTRLVVVQVVVIWFVTLGVRNAQSNPPSWLHVPLGLEELAFDVPADNSLTPAKVALGKKLFHENRLSKSGKMSCATCHVAKRGLSDGNRLSVKDNGAPEDRNTATLINRVFGRSQFMDGFSPTLEAASAEPIKGGLANTVEAAVAALQSLPEYRPLFQAAFNGSITADTMLKALAAYQRTLLSGNSPFDRFNHGQVKAISAAAARGFDLFQGKARCVGCHTGANFTDEEFHNLGVGTATVPYDNGRFEVTHQEIDRGAFKTPTLRDIARTAPYMHDGSFVSLEAVVAFYNAGGVANPRLDRRLRPLHLTAPEAADLVEFLKTLNGDWLASNLHPQGVDQ